MVVTEEERMSIARYLTFLNANFGAETTDQFNFYHLVIHIEMLDVQISNILWNLICQLYLFLFRRKLSKTKTGKRAMFKQMNLFQIELSP